MIIILAVFTILAMILAPLAFNYVKTSIDIQKEIKQLEDKPPEDFDPHYARNLEIETGMRITVQCEDETCTKCYWKPRMLKKGDVYPDRFTGRTLNYERKRLIERMIDGMSDDFYDMELQSWEEENAERIKKAKKEEADFQADKAKRDIERAYATPISEIEKYKRQGRTYDSGSNSWSAATVMSPNEFRDRLKKVEADLDNVDKVLNSVKVKPKPKRFELEFVYDTVQDKYYVFEWELRGLARTGAVTTTEITREFFNENRNHRGISR